MSSTFDYAGAREAGYSDDEIISHLAQQNPKFDFQAASQAGYSPQEIIQHLGSAEPKKTKSKLKKAGRIGAQYALGAAESALLPYEIAVAPLASEEAQMGAYRGNISDDIERLQEQKESGIWDAQDQELYDSLVQQLQNPEKSKQFVRTADIGVKGLAEKATGIDLTPEGTLEKAAVWTGFIKNPAKLSALAKTGINPKSLFKAIAPSGKEALRGLGAGAGLQAAEEGEFGPIGTLAAAVIGDLAGGGVAGLAKAAITPKKSLASLAAKLSAKDKLAVQKELIKDFRESGLQADVGTLTDSDLMKWLQSRLAQSGLTGKALDDLKQQMTSQIKEEYKGLADSLGQAKFSTSHEAGEVVKESMKKIRDADMAATRELYQNANNALKEGAQTDTKKLAEVITRIEKQLKPGALKSSEQKAVLDVIDTLKHDIFDSEGGLISGNVKDLMNNKVAINDIINYQVQGGAKQFLKTIVSELDRAIIGHGKQNPTFAKNYINANRKFANHAKTFRNRSVETLLRAEDPMSIINKMNSVQGIKNMGNILNRTPEGRETFKNLKRLKLDQVVGDNLVDSTTQQVKLGTFSKLLEKGKNREIIKEILGPQSMKRLERLQSNTGRLADTAQKFFNASKTGVTISDVAVVGKALSDMAHLFAGNPWPIAKTSGGIVGARYLTKLIADPSFLKLVEDAILASSKEDTALLMQIGEKLAKPIQAALVQTQKPE